MESILDGVARRVVEWLWTPPKGVPIEAMETSEWAPAEAEPLPFKRLRRPITGRGSRAPIPRRINEFYHRGAYERHEVHTRRAKKAGLRFRGKGAKVERRHHKRAG